MKFFSLLACTALLAGIAGCTRMKVVYEQDAAYNFSGIKTYQWVDAPEKIMEQGDMYLDVQLQKALNNELADMGWKQVLEATNATVQTTYYLEITSHREYTDTTPDKEREFTGGLVYSRDKKAWSYEEREPELLAYTIDVGTLHFTIADVHSGQFVWQGTVETKIDRTLSPEKRNRLFQNIARKLFEKLPPESN